MHEHLDEMGVIHMNGRVYDPAIGRFMSADPFIQSPGNLQSFNRYAYVMNNPLAFTDPSGYFSLKKFFRTVAAIVVGFYAPQFLPGILNSAGLTALAGSKVAVGAIAGGLSSSAGAGSFKAFGQGALTGGCLQVRVSSAKALA